MLLPLDKIRTDGGTQPREKIDYLLVQEYQEAYKAGVKFPAVVVFYDGKQYWLADGFHRVSALPVTGADEIEAEIKQGTLADAVWYSCGVNSAHGQRRTSEDKRRAVETALQHHKSKGMSDRAIAQHCGVDPSTVSKIRLQVLDSNTSNEPRTGIDGKEHKPHSDKRSEAGKASAKKRAEKKAEPTSAEPKEEAPAKEDSTSSEPAPDYDHVVSLVMRLPAVQQDNLVRLINGLRK